MARLLILLGALCATAFCQSPPTTQLVYYHQEDAMFLQEIDIVGNGSTPAFKPVTNPILFKNEAVDVTQLTVTFSPGCEINVINFANVFRLNVTRNGNDIELCTNNNEQYKVTCTNMDHYKIKFSSDGGKSRYVKLTFIGQVVVNSNSDVIQPTTTVIQTTQAPPAVKTAKAEKASYTTAIVICILVGIVCLGAGVAAGYFGRGFYEQKYKKKTPPSAKNIEPSHFGAPVVPSYEPSSTVTTDMKTKLDSRKPKDSSKKETKPIPDPSVKKTQAETMSEKISKKEKKNKKDSKEKTSKIDSKEKASKKDEEKPLLKSSKE